MPAKPKSVEEFKVPPGTIIIVVDEIKKALGQIPNAVVISPAEYQKLLDRIKELEKRVKPDHEGAGVAADGQAGREPPSAQGRVHPGNGAATCHRAAGP